MGHHLPLHVHRASCSCLPAPGVCVLRVCVCALQTYETGLFRTQLEDGIMGLSNQELTIVPKLKVRVYVFVCVCGE
jgi:hypothetical protein